MMRSATAKAPARANIIGEHTDYNSGYVLPTVLPFFTTVSIEEKMGDATSIEFTSDNFPTPHVRDLKDNKQNHWSDYVLGCLRVLHDRGVTIPAMSIHVVSNIPMGAGVSSSAALSVATLRALQGLLGLNLSDEDIATLAHRSEFAFVGVPCGKMDQFVCSLGKPGYAFFLDTQSMAFRHVPLPENIDIMLVNCGKVHSLAKGGGYSQRVAECQEACALLGVETLRSLEISDLGRLEGLPPLIARRARHVITENQRVLDSVKALEESDMETLAKLMAASHISQRDDYQVSVPEIDRLVESSNRFGIKACRLTGGGFGGSVIALVPREQNKAWWNFVSNENPESFLISTYALNDQETA